MHAASIIKHQPDQCRNCYNAPYQFEFILLDIAQYRFDRMAEIVAGEADG
jgi:hypothetical protein